MNDVWDCFIGMRYNLENSNKDLSIIKYNT